jgi:hypothetical protein
VVLVHGIGSVAIGDVLQSAIEAIRIEYPDAAISEPRQVRDAGSQVPLINERTVNVHWEDHNVLITEFVWSGIEEKIRMSKPIDAVRKLFALIAIAPTVGLSSASAGWLKAVSHSYARGFPFVLGLFVAGPICILLGTAIGMFASSSWEQLNLANLVLFSLPLTLPAAMFWATGLAGLAWASVQRACRIGAYEAVFAVWLSIGIAVLISLALGYGLLLLVGLIGAVLHSFSEPSWDLLIAVPLVLVVSTLIDFVPALVIANLLRDVVLYLGTNEAGDTRPQQRAVREQLWSCLCRLRSRAPETEMVIVGHSLGSVIVVDTLRERQRTVADGYLQVHLVTAGSPLRRLIRRLLPNRMPPIKQLREELGGEHGVRVVRWVNCYRICDYVGQALLFSALPRVLWFAPLTQQGMSPPIEDRLIDRPLSFRFGRTNYGHANYWGDERFLGLVARDVLGPILRRGRE